MQGSVVSLCCQHKIYLFNKAPIEHKWAQAKSKKKREWLRYRDFVLSPYGVIKIKSLGYTPGFRQNIAKRHYFDNN
ncbi:hypothetical protein [Symbiopectobacterium sp. RP]|uniref:hypothetical protein n=1 Tax=Symbiopectobacterium sp. RP TaxID=3248553 RepID=UPI003D2B3097